jgi:hypothetical protein
MADWKKKLNDLFEHQSREEQNHYIKAVAAAIKPQKAADKFLCTVVDPALGELAEELYKYERKACTFRGRRLSRDMEVRFQNTVEFRYTAKVCTGSVKNTVHTSYMARYPSGREEQGEGIIMKDGKQADITDLAKEDIIHDFLKRYIVRHTYSTC